MDAFQILYSHQDFNNVEQNTIPISEENKHIEEYLDYYCNLPSPKFAVLIKGKWGSGKSWFIEEYRKKLDNKAKLDKSGKKSLYVSLNGITNISDIQDSLFQQLHPLLASEQMVVARQIFKGLAKLTFKIDLDKTDKKPDDATWNFSIPDIKRMQRKFNDSKFSLLIFDDLERCNIPLETILGYINAFVDSQKLKVVIIGNEDEINNTEEKYKNMKEKLIGQTLEVVPDLQAAVQMFINAIEGEEVKQYLLNNTSLIRDLYMGSRSKNLRSINKIILNFKRIFDRLPEKAKKTPKLIKDILKILIIFSIEIDQGELVPSDISNLKAKLDEDYISLSKIRSQKQKESNEESTLKFKSMFDKYDPWIFLHSASNIFPSLLWWESFFDKGNVNVPMLEKLLPDSIYFQDENTPVWKKLERYYEYSDEEFQQLLNKLDSEYKNKSFEKIEIVNEIFKLLFMFSDFGLYSKSKSDILKEAKTYIDFLKDEGKLDWNFIDRTFIMEQNQIENLSEYRELSEYIIKSQLEAREGNIANEVKELLSIMENNVDDFCVMIQKNVPEINYIKHYYDEPIFKYIDAKKFVDTIYKIPNQKIYDLFSALQFRYLDYNKTSIHSWGQKLVEEIDFLEKTQSLLLEKIADKPSQLSSYLLKTSSEHYLQKVINKIKEYKDQSIKSETSF